MAGFHLNFSMVALYETRLRLMTFKFYDCGVTLIFCGGVIGDEAKVGDI